MMIAVSFYFLIEYLYYGYLSIKSSLYRKEFDFSRIIVVLPTKIKLLDPYVHDDDDGGRFASIPLRSLKQIPGILRSRNRNLHRFPLRVAIISRPATVVPTKSGRYTGQDGAFAAVLAAKLNATPVYVTNFSNTKIYYGYKQTDVGSYGTFSGLIEGRADISVNGHFLKDYNCYSVELTRHVSDNNKRFRKTK